MKEGLYLSQIELVLDDDLASITGGIKIEFSEKEKSVFKKTCKYTLYTVGGLVISLASLVTILLTIKEISRIIESYRPVKSWKKQNPDNYRCCEDF
ncbi:MAG: hypothetical protein IJC57_02190 [Clostridia bacterium]|nr:hypothetical protein [Clostridia bacterium]